MDACIATEADTAIPIGTALHMQRVDEVEQQEARLYCYSEQHEQKELGINQHLCERLNAGLQKIADAPATSHVPKSVSTNCNSTTAGSRKIPRYRSTLHD
ncbi:protein of unknown function [Methylotuvimicrobium alcaliphilum 20Z]|uniref:Uncharacterized protein n=2 Tax=Methylotuvimicrobium alcaliphilum TaxID=271065 RepID=G4SYT2_META2|nr:protein of unknown function [Methylotuvimicrobium alcaliphilum 20Z]